MTYFKTFLVLVSLIVGCNFLTSHKNDSFEITSEAVSKSSDMKNLEKNDAEKRISDLQNGLDAIFEKYPDIKISVALDTSLSNDEIRVYGDSSAYIAASTTKVITAVYYLRLVEEGKRTIEQKIGDYNAKWQIEQMINQSNNNSWYLLNDNLGYSNLEEYALSIGLTSFNSIENTITAEDENLLLQKIYSDELISKEHRDLLLSCMQNTNYETLIPAAVPSDVTVYHKYGLLYNNLHDNSIIVHDGGAIYLTVMTDSESTINYVERTKLFHEIVSLVLEYEQINFF